MASGNLRGATYKRFNIKEFLCQVIPRYFLRWRVA